MPVYNMLPTSGGGSTAEVLWEGNFSGAGSITVPGISDWALVGYVNYENETYILVGNPTRGGGLYGKYDSASIETMAYRFGLSGDTLTVSSADRVIYFENTTTYSGGNNNHIRKIYGLVKKSAQ